MRPSRISYCARASAAGVQHVAHLLRIGQLAVDARDQAPAIDPVGDLKPLIGHRVADLKVLPTISCAQLRVVERRRASLREIGHGQAVRRLGAQFRGRRVPDRRGPGAILDGRRHVARRRHAQGLGVVGGPARGRNLQHPGIIEGVQARIELRVGPYRLQFHGADRVRVGGVLDVDRIADRRQRHIVAA